MTRFVIPIQSFISCIIKRRLNRWLKRRIPPASQHKLSNRNIFIMPTRFGFVYLVFVVLLFLLATNYQNNVIMLLSYLMASVFITTMMHSFFNLSGIEVSTDKQVEGYAKQYIMVPVKILSPNNRLDFNFCFDHQKMSHLPQTVQGNQTVYVSCRYENRGVHYPGRLKIWSEYPLGLFITWTRIDFDFKCMLYPAAEPVRHIPSNFAGSVKQNSFLENTKPGIDEFFELKTHIPGEPLSRVAWKQFARGQGRLTKHYHQQQGATCWLKLTDMPKHGLEKQLQYLCFLVKEYNDAAQIFGLDLGQEKIKPSQGQQHFNQCLMALALYPKLL
ncbi:MAG: hypothetical protein ACI9N3_001716 [Colwellia sp.]|uniref:DUF58 domain-containing protein n=1 Tax=Colwellia sp. Bg11-12 TaxID=2759817 RepID=UPI0015F4AF9E|nr:DUF58 domain-containing protein [Colwellia sp. Bg11-12]MBA6265280.1 DUF58 domain-containing protein [Colwellia sp. Bg11-12]